MKEYFSNNLNSYSNQGNWPNFYGLKSPQASVQEFELNEKKIESYQRDLQRLVAMQMEYNSFEMKRSEACQERLLALAENPEDFEKNYNAFRVADHKKQEQLQYGQELRERILATADCISQTIARREELLINLKLQVKNKFAKLHKDLRPLLGLLLTEPNFFMLTLGDQEEYALLAHEEIGFYVDLERNLELVDALLKTLHISISVHKQEISGNSTIYKGLADMRHFLQYCDKNKKFLSRLWSFDVVSLQKSSSRSKDIIDLIQQKAPLGSGAPGLFNELSTDNHSENPSDQDSEEKSFVFLK